MRRNHLLLPLLGLLAVTYAAPDERKKFVRVITEPKPGEEYVSIHTGKPSSGVPEKHLDDDMEVNIQDEGQTGIKEVSGPVPIEEKLYAHKKLYPSNEEGPRRSKPEKKYTPISTEETVSPDGSFTKSNNKLKNKRDGEIVTHSVQEKTSDNKHDDGLYDFVDSPFGGQIVSAASSQASRVNIKKAPNGQEYEYEYVYYYYDEDEEHAKPGSKTSQSTLNSPPSQQTSSKPNKDIKETTTKPKKTAVVQDENQFVQNTNRGRFPSVEHVTTTEEPEGHANFAVNDIAEHNSKTKESGRNLEEALSVPSSSGAVSEERLPHNPRFPARSRGNSRPSQEIVTTILPATDTPITRIRGSNGPHQPGLDLVDSSAFRTHSNNGQHITATSPRHESTRKDAVVQTTPADQVATINNAYNTQLTETVTSVTETVSLDRNQDNTDADAKGLSLTTTLIPDEVATITQRYTAGSTDKGAVDLYAILQQARSEETANAISSIEHSTRYEDSETQFPTTLRLAPTTTTTTTTTTPVPTTTTTTTTTAATVPVVPTRGSGPVRSRYRGTAGSRNGSPTPSTTTTTTEQPPAEETTEKRKFKPSRERNTQGSVYSKRYQSSTAALDKESSTIESEVVTKAQKPSFGRQRTRASKPVSSTAPIDENVEVTSAAPKPNFAERSNLRRQNSRNKFTTSASTTTTTTVSPQIAEGEENNASEQEVSEPTSTTARAVGGRLRPNIRPLRPGLRLNFGGKGSSTTASPIPSTTQAHISESSPDEVEEKEVVQEPSSTPAPDTLSKLKNKSRFRVPEKQASLAPKQQTIAPPATGQNRKHLLSNLLPKKKSIQTEEPPVLEEVKPVAENDQENDQIPESQNEDDIDRQQPSSTTTSTTEAPTSSTNRLSSLLAKRRPLQRRPADLSSKQSNQEE